MSARHGFALGSALVVAGVFSAHGALAEGRSVALEECVSIAIAHNPDARSADFEVDAAESTRSGVRGELLPKLRAEGNVQEWNAPFDLPFSLPGASGPPPVLRVRDQLTWGATFTVTQPLTGLFNTFDRYKVEQMGVDVARIRRDVTRRDLGFRVAETYLRLLESLRLEDVAKSSVTQLEAQRKQAQSLYTNGVIGKNDALRADLALASAKQREIQARGQILLVRGRLAVLLGMSPDAPLEPVAFVGEPPPPEEASLEGAEAKAAAQRLEVREVAQRITREEARVAAARARLLPTVSAVGSYLHAEGSAFQQKDSAFVGVVGSWDVWDWGTTTSGIGEAAARREQAKLAKAKLEDEVRLEARQAYVNLDSSRELLAVAKSAVEQAEENYRIVTKRFEQAAGTSFDVVDAESLLTAARGQHEDALYGYLVARIGLQRATGAMMPRVR